MPFYHDETNLTVISAPDTPEVQENKGQHGEPLGWTIWATLEIARADNYINPKTQQWVHPVTKLHREVYDLRDSRESAIGYFKTFKYPQDLPEISSEEYQRLRAKYLAIAQSNKPPAS